MSSIFSAIFGGGDKPSPAPAPLPPFDEEKARRERSEIALSEQRRAASGSSIHAGALLALEERQKRNASKVLG